MVGSRKETTGRRRQARRRNCHSDIVPREVYALTDEVLLLDRGWWGVYKVGGSVAGTLEVFFFMAYNTCLI